MSIFLGSIKTESDERINKYVSKALKLIKDLNLPSSEYDDVSKMYAMELAQKVHGNKGAKYSEAFKMYKSVILQKIKAKMK
jgi:hypothetical protein